MVNILASMLINKGVNVIGNLLSNGVDEVANKTTDFIKEKTGIDLAKNNPTPEEIEKLRQLEIEHAETLKEFTLEKLRLEQQRFETAHKTYRENHSMADKIAKAIINWNLPIIFLLVFMNLYILDTFKDNASLLAVASNIIGIAIGKLFSERQSVINFFYGSSIGSKDKDVQIASMKQ